MKTEHKYDSYCKKVLSQKWVAARLLKHYVEEYHDCTVEEIIHYVHDPKTDPQNESDTFESRNIEDVDADIRYDVILYASLPNSKDAVGIIINLEAQGYRPKYPILKRGIYYLSCLIARQKGNKPGFANSQYGKLKKVVGIWIYNQRPAKQGMVNIYEINEEIKGKKVHMKKEEYDLMRLVLVSPKEETEGKDEMMDILSLLFGSKGKVAKDTLFRLENEYGIVMTEKESQEVEEMCNWSEVRLQQGREEGIQQGIQQGREEGIQQGREEQQYTIAMNLLKEEVPISIIEKATQISLKKLLEMKQKLALKS